MKKSFIMFCVSLLCMKFSNAQNFKEQAVDAKDPAFECFIKLSDSTILRYSRLKYKTPPLSYGFLEGDGKKLKYGVMDILSFQDEKGYWLRVSTPPKISIGTAPLQYYFAVRIVKGKIELFAQYANNGKSVLDDRYSSGYIYYAKKDSILIQLDRRGIGLRNMMKDNKKIYNDFGEARTMKIDDMMDFVQQYNKKIK